VKNLSRKIKILISIIVIIFVSVIGMYNYRKPITIYKVFNNAIVTKSGNGEVVKKANIELRASLTRGVYRGSIINFDAHFINKLEGKIKIDNKEYYFDGYTKDSKVKNILGSVYENKQSDTAIFWIKMNDLDSMMLIDMGENR
jgi:hypothetical protein